MAKRVSGSRKSKAQSQAASRATSSEKPSTPGAQVPTPDESGVPVAGICASAGGLDAFKKLFDAMPVDTGIAFVLVPHLGPTHESLMAELLQRHTTMPVHEAVEGTAVEANQVYIIPPNKYLAISDGVLRLTGPVERSGPKTAIDFFLGSLAGDRRERAIGVIMSGTDSHGIVGLKAIKAAGGLTIAQDPSTAAYSGMPRNAVNSGIVDLVLPVAEIPKAIVRYVRHESVYGDEATIAEPVGLAQILNLLRTRGRLDFRSYRKKMLMRRIERRMNLNQLDRLDDYISFLRDHPEEINVLSQDLLINVTSFFRDPEAWTTLSNLALAPLIAEKDPDVPLRAWTAGCATGEEPYSLGISLLELLSAQQKYWGADETTDTPSA